MKKRILSLLLALVLALSLLPVNTFAADDTAAAVSKMTKMSFAGTPAFDADNVYFEQSEGTLFQLDDKGNRTGSTGVDASGTCKNYAVYVSPDTESVKPAGTSFIVIRNQSFVYSPVTAIVTVKVDGEVLFSNKMTNTAVATAWNSTKVDLVENETKLEIILKDKETSAESVTTVTFIRSGALSAEEVAKKIDALDVRQLSWPGDVSKVRKAEVHYTNLSQEEQAKITSQQKENLAKAVELMRPDRVPEKLGFITHPGKITYSAGQKFEPSGAKLLATYADGTTRTLDENYYTVTPSTVLTNETKATFSYNGVSIDQEIKIVGFVLDGEGTESAPYKLSSAEDLVNLRDFVAAGGDTKGKYFLMTEDITLPDGWTPIGCTKDGTHNVSGTNLLAFSGTIDGGGKLLTVPKGGKPLLGYVKNAAVKNLNIYGEQINGYGLVDDLYGVGFSSGKDIAVVIENVTLKSGSKTLRSGFIGTEIDYSINGFAGASAAFTTTIRNCTIEEGVTIGYDGTQSEIGSFAGRFQGTIENCVSYATVQGVNYVGGIIGTRDNALGTCAVDSCIFGGTVTASGNNAGGIVGGGYNNSSAPNGIRITIKNCVATKTASVSGKENVGGILGSDVFVAQAWNGYTLADNMFFGKVSGQENVGGIIGYYRSLNKFDNISNNIYAADCGATKGIGTVAYVDTSYANPTKADGVLYFNTANGVSGCPRVNGCIWKADHNRTDDPLGKDAVKLCRSTNESLLPDDNGAGTPGSTASPATGDTGVLVWVIALPVAALAAAFVLKRKEREA